MGGRKKNGRKMEEKWKKNGRKREEKWKKNKLDKIMGKKKR